MNLINIILIYIVIILLPSFKKGLGVLLESLVIATQVLIIALLTIMTKTIKLIKIIIKQIKNIWNRIWKR